MTRKHPTVVTREKKAQFLNVSMISLVSGIQCHTDASFTWIVVQHAYQIVFEGGMSHLQLLLKGCNPGCEGVDDTLGDPPARFLIRLDLRDKHSDHQRDLQEGVNDRKDWIAKCCYQSGGNVARSQRIVASCRRQREA